MAETMAETEETSNSVRGIIVLPLLLLLGVGLYLGSTLGGDPPQDAAPGVQAEAPAQAPLQPTDQLSVEARVAAVATGGAAADQTTASTEPASGPDAVSGVTVAEEAGAEDTVVVETGAQESAADPDAAAVPAVPSTIEFVPARTADTDAPSDAELAAQVDAVKTAAQEQAEPAGETVTAALAAAAQISPASAPDADDALATQVPQTGEIAPGLSEGPGATDAANIDVPTQEAQPSLVEAEASALPEIVTEARDPGEPSFDLVRIDEDGAGLVAGRAEPGTTVRILSGQTELATVAATSTGEFVAFIAAPIDGEGRSLSLVAEDQSGTTSRSQSDVFVLPAEVQESADQPAAPAIVEASAEGVRLLQPAGLAAVQGVTLDSVSYARDGAVVLAGRAPLGADLRIYADGAALGDVRAGATGSWTATLSDLDAGVYTLRIDEIDGVGAVKSRVESPFQRVFPSAEVLDRPTSITVQPGNTLWVMARDRYGSGFEYTQIFAANADLIRDPDLIYPGQIFSLPDDNRTAN
ncbi:MAG: hypothetical protein AAFR93_01650 [Pseudomonadota bacterium]